MELALNLDKSLETELRQHGEQTHPHECCGALLGRDVGDVFEVTAVSRLDNVHQDGHERRYLIDPKQLLALLRQERETGLMLLGFYHSHPDHPACPSEYDTEWAMPWYIYAIVSIEHGVSALLTAWRLNDQIKQFLPVQIIAGDTSG